MWLTLVGSVTALIFAIFLIIGIMKKEKGTKEMAEISEHVHSGAMAYIKQQYKVVAIFFIALFAILSFIAWILPMLNGGQKLLSHFVPIAFITGGFFSALAGFIGMKVATRANCRTAWAASKSLNAGLRVAFNAGTVMGMVVVGLGLLDLSIWWVLLKYVFLPMQFGLESASDIPGIMITFGMGASSAALFARLGGGIYTKAADVGADLVGKVEAGIPEDDPRNPATIADNVGDNVGDVAGMGADLYESYVGSIVATMALGAVAALAMNMGDLTLTFIQLPGFIAVIGVIASIIGTFLVRAKDDASQKTLLGALRFGVYSSTVLIAIASFFIIYFMLPNYLGLWGSIMVGLLAGNIIAYFTEYYTSDHYKPTRTLAETAKTGPATIIIGGLSLGMMSTAIPVITVVLGTLGAFFFAGGGLQGLYGIGLAAVGMLSTLGITLATDAYGPIADNAGGIAEMTHMDPEVRKRTDALDSLGNTTAATGKGFAIGSAALTALALLAEYGHKVIEFLNNQLQAGSAKITALIEQGVVLTKEIDGKTVVDSIMASILEPTVLVGVFIGVLLPFIFSALSMGAVGRAAYAMVDEVRRQFKEKPGILKGTEQPDYARCVQISTKGAQREMIVPSLIAIITPIVVGILFGPFTVLAMIAGTVTAGFVLAIMMANSGGAWDNAKKYIEAGALGGKKSDAHKAAVVGDTVGDPFKDTSGPCINILIKLMSMVSIVFVGTCISINDQVFEFIGKLFGA
ncbi:MAG: sodium-translocating pyrophosphatase [Spirochaetales bacterium]|nr:sodium-translocating pyrophosphatase [Spirochaetales bacterium]